MASATDLALLKKHVKADDFTDDDVYLGHLFDAAESYIVSATNRTHEELEGEGTALPATLIQAIIMLAGHWYNQREAVAAVQMAEVPYSVTAIVKSYRKLADDPEED